MIGDDDRKRPPGQFAQGLSAGPGLLRPLATSALVTSLLMGLVIVIDLVAPDRVWSYLPASIFLIALEAVLTTRWLAHPDRRQVSRGAYRLSEFMVIAVLLRLLTWALTGGLPGPALLRQYILSPLSILDGLYFGYLLCAILAWERAIHFSTLFLRLDPSHAERAFYALPLSEQQRQYHDRPIAHQRPLAFSQLAKSWVNGGFLLGIFSALTTIDLPAIDISEGVRSIARVGLRPEMLAALLVYFILGLWLISQARLAMMRATWLADNVTARPELTASWRRTSLIVLAAFAFLVAFLPIGSTLGASLLLQGLVTIMFAVARFIFLLFSIPLFLLLKLLGVSNLPEGPGETPPGQVTPPSAPAGGPLGETTALIAGGAFWLLVGFVAVAALLFFLHDRGHAPSLQRLGQWWRGLLMWLKRGLRGATDQASSLQKAVRRRLPSARKGRELPGGLWPSLRINALPPESQIRYFYLLAVKRAGEKGVPRSESETPSEYERDLKQEWPEVQEEIEALTGAFLEARYSAHEIKADEVGPAKRWWKRIRGILRRAGSGRRK